MKSKFRLVSLFAVAILGVAACTNQSEDASSEQANGSLESTELTEVNQQLEPTVGAASEAPPSADDVDQSTPLPEPTDTPSIEPEATEKPSGLQNPDFAEFEADAFDIQLAYPNSWLITEEPEIGLFIESNEGFFDSLPDGEGAGIIIFPRDELASEEIVEALRVSVFNFGPPPSIFINFPTVSMVGEQEFATAAFDERDTGTEGFYVFIQNGDRGVFVFAAASGLVKADFLNTLEEVIGTVMLGEVVASSS
jgi:hypothetical protein